MNAQVHMTVLGTIIALVFASSMISLITWMFRVPPPISRTLAKVRQSFSSVKTILVPTIGTYYSSRGIELACRLGLEQKAEILLTYIIEIPIISPLNIPVRQEEEKAKEILEDNKKIVEFHGLNCSTLIQKARTAGAGIVQLANERQTDLIVMGIKSKFHGDIQDIIGRTANWLIKRSPCEVIVDKMPEEEEA